MEDAAIADRVGYAIEARFGIPIDVAQTIARNVLHTMTDQNTPRHYMLSEMAAAFEARYPLKISEIREVLSEVNLGE